MKVWLVFNVDNHLLCKVERLDTEADLTTTELKDASVAVFDQETTANVVVYGKLTTQEQSDIATWKLSGNMPAWTGSALTNESAVTWESYLSARYVAKFTAPA